MSSVLAAVTNTADALLARPVRRDFSIASLISADPTPRWTSVVPGHSWPLTAEVDGDASSPRDAVCCGVASVQTPPPTPPSGLPSWTPSAACWIPSGHACNLASVSGCTLLPASYQQFNCFTGTL